MKIPSVLVVSLLTCTVAAQSRNPLDLATAQVSGEARRIAGGTDPLQFGELRLPSTKGPHPVAIVVHGGCWVAKLGNLDPRGVAMDNHAAAGLGFDRRRHRTWNIEYRRLITKAVDGPAPSGCCPRGRLPSARSSATIN